MAPSPVPLALLGGSPGAPPPSSAHFVPVSPVRPGSREASSNPATPLFFSVQAPPPSSGPSLRRFCACGLELRGARTGGAGQGGARAGARTRGRAPPLPASPARLGLGGSGSGSGGPGRAAPCPAAEEAEEEAGARADSASGLRGGAKRAPGPWGMERPRPGPAPAPIPSPAPRGPERRAQLGRQDQCPGRAGQPEDEQAAGGDPGADLQGRAAPLSGPWAPHPLFGAMPHPPFSAMPGPTRPFPPRAGRAPPPQAGPPGGSPGGPIRLPRCPCPRALTCHLG
ncbi:uncharacterized protein LOC116423572 [Sarcophilus harrisii]|uniref:uncharacterized protein LOC116423572 n=1 Tax=Sarcophilus harrisii TaxID=9305 RepID=UPI001301EDE9|nr:uncharacterized protein LOC116423572 [Sarcophilus harrisii]